MPSFRPDAKGYYAALGLSPEASPDEIKAAFRRLAKELHPDTNRSADASRRFQQLRQAFDTLSNPDSRLAYDRLHESLSRAGGLLDPLTCNACGRTTAALRYAVFQLITGIGLHTHKVSRDGIYCPDCLAQKAFAANVHNWLLGWWGLAAPFHNLRAITRNALGGLQPAEDNARLLAYQARAFASRSAPLPAKVAAEAAMAASQRAKGLAEIGREMKSLLQSLATQKGKSPRAARRVNWWRPALLFLQTLPLLAIGAVILSIMPPWPNKPTRNSPATAERARQTAGTPANSSDLRYIVFDVANLRAGPGPDRVTIERLSRFETVEVVGTSDSGWLAVKTSSGKTGYLSSAHVAPGRGEVAWAAECRRSLSPAPVTGTILFRRMSGIHTLLLRNSANADAIVKLRDTAGAAVMAVFVRKGETAALDTIPDGEFRISYAVGEDYSEGCGTFLKGFRAHAFPEADLFRTGNDAGFSTFTRIEYTLITDPGSRRNGTSPDSMAFSRN